MSDYLDSDVDGGFSPPPPSADGSGGMVPTTTTNVISTNLDRVVHQMDRETAVSRRRRLWRYATSPYGMAVATAAIVFLLLFFIDPPMVQSHQDASSIERHSIDLLRLVLWSAGAGATVLVSALVLQRVWNRR